MQLSPYRNDTPLDRMINDRLAETLEREHLQSEAHHAARGHLACVDCHVWLRAKDFSKSELGKGENLTCKQCKKRSEYQIRSAHQDSRCCHSCNQVLARSLFSKTQWSKGAEGRCKSCVGGQALPTTPRQSAGVHGLPPMPRSPPEVQAPLARTLHATWLGVPATARLVLGKLPRRYNHPELAHEPSLESKRPVYQHVLHEPGCAHRHVLVLRDAKAAEYVALVVEPEHDQTPFLAVHSPQGGCVRVELPTPKAKAGLAGLVHTMVALRLPRRAAGDLALLGGYCAGDRELHILDPWAAKGPTTTTLRGHTSRPMGAALVSNGRLVSIDEGGELLVWSARDDSLKAWELKGRANLIAAIDRTSGNMTPTLVVSCGARVATIDSVMADEDTFGLAKGKGTNAKQMIAVQLWDVDGTTPTPARTALLRVDGYRPYASAAAYFAHSTPSRLVLSVDSTLISLVMTADELRGSAESPPPPSPEADKTAAAAAKPSASVSAVAFTPVSPSASAATDASLSNDDFRKLLLSRAPSEPSLCCELLTLDVEARHKLVAFDDIARPRLVVLSDHILGNNAEAVDMTHSPRRTGVLTVRNEHRSGRRDTCDEYFECGAFLADGRLVVGGTQMRDDGPRPMLGGLFMDDSLAKHGMSRILICASVHGRSFSGDPSLFFERPASNRSPRSSTAPTEPQDSVSADQRRSELELIAMLPTFSDSQLEECHSDMMMTACTLGMPPEILACYRMELEKCRGRRRRELMEQQVKETIQTMMEIQEDESSLKPPKRQPVEPSERSHRHPEAPSQSHRKGRSAGTGPAKSRQLFTPDDPRAEGLREGDWVRLHGLSSRGDLNGKKAKIIGGFDASNGRFPVRVAEQKPLPGARRACQGESIKVKPSNLELHRYKFDVETTCSFVRRNGDIECKDIFWCRTNGFKQVDHHVWAGDWWDEFDEQKRQDALAESPKELHEDQDDPVSDDFVSDSGSDACSDDVDEYGFTPDEVHELALQGIRPWDPEARAAVSVLFDY